MNQYFATVARGLEALAAQELTELGAQFTEIGFCGVFFQGDIELLYKGKPVGALAFSDFV
jgi:putative N6-adenine-specific DNA methylase